MVETVVFDLGGVLIDWNPRYLYRKLIPKEEEMEHFLATVTTSAWNGQQDAGRTWEEATEQLIESYPDKAEWIRAYAERWPEMISGQIDGTVEILETLHQRGTHRLLALTNWSHETFPIALERFAWLTKFEGILVSGEEKLVKPDQRIYELLIERYKFDREKAIFIDDSPANVEGAQSVGLQALYFKNPSLLKEQLIRLNIL